MKDEENSIIHHTKNELPIIYTIRNLLNTTVLSKHFFIGMPKWF